MSLYDEDYELRQGTKELKMWPFKPYNPRMVCAGEYRVKQKIDNDLGPTNHPCEMTLRFAFKEHGADIYWKLNKKREEKLGAAFKEFINAKKENEYDPVFVEPKKEMRLTKLLKN